MRVLSSFESGTVAVTRPRGQVYQFLPPPSGTVYVGDGDVADRLERLLDGSGAFVGWRYTTADGDLAEQYDTAGNLITLTTRSGQVASLEYSTASTPESIALKPGLLIKVTDHFGRELNFTYDFQSRVVTMTDAGGGQYTFAYDGPSAVVLADNAPVSNLTSVTFPGGMQRVYHYNEQAHTASTNLPDAFTGITDENGERFATFQYDAQGRAVSSQHAAGALSYTIAYGAGISTVTDPLGTSRDYGVQTVQGVAKIPSITGPACPQCGPASQTFDANGNVETRTDWNGNRTNYSYDLARNLETSRTEGLTSAGAVTPATRTIETEWHPTFRLPTRITEKDSAGAVLRETAMSHDAAGNVLSRTITAGASSRSWSYTYNTNGSMETANGPRTDVSDVTSYAYYANDDPDPGKRGNLASVTNALGHVTQITAYNSHGQPLTIVDPNGLTTTLAYDERLRLTSRDVGGELTSYEYDGVGQLKKVTLPDGSFLAYTYDPAHRLTDIIDALGNLIHYGLDAMGNRTLEQVRDPVGALARTRSRVFNSLNRLFQEIGAQNQTTQYAYDNQGNVTSVDGPLAGTVDVTTNTYDALNRLIGITDPASGQVSYGYNALDQLTSVTDPRSLLTSYDINGLGDLNQQVSPDTGTTANTYDSAGNLQRSTDAKDQVTNYAYDALKRVTSITFHDGSRQTYAYDQGMNGLGRLSSVTETDPGSQVTSQIAYAYDSHGRVTSETRTVGGIAYVTAYSYDSFGRMSGMTYPSGRTVTYGFDGLARVNQVNTTRPGESAQAVVQNVTYHPFGGVTGFTFGNGQVYSRSVDQDGRIFSYSLGGANFAIGFDDASRITAITETGNPSNVNSYGYDNLDRLTQAILPFVTYGYGYDAVGNRMSKTAGANTDTYAYPGTSNRLGSVTPSSGPVRTYAHDAVGSITADGVNTYAYDARGRMVQALSSLGTTSYQVNALGQRIRKTNVQGDTVFHYDAQGRLIAESSAAGAVRKEYLYLGDIPVGVVQ
jgi:YD repeat-containing protein